MLSAELTWASPSDPKIQGRLYLEDFQRGPELKLTDPGTVRYHISYWTQWEMQSTEHGILTASPFLAE
jgi:hypothetical protein